MENNAGTKKREKKKKKWWFWAIVLPLGILFIGFVCLVIYLETTPFPALDINVSIGTRLVVDKTKQDQKTSSDDDTAELVYSSPKEALEAFDSLSDVVFLSDPLARSSSEDTETIVYFCQRGEERDNKAMFLVPTFEVNEGGFSIMDNHVRSAFCDISVYHNGRFSYNTEVERVGEYIINRLSYSFLGQPDTFSYFGVSADPNIGDLTILGKSPDGVIEYSYEGTDYYFWYYDDLDIYGYLQENLNFSFDKFTLREIIEVLKIEYDE